MPQAFQRVGLAEAGFDDMAGQPPLQRIGKLMVENLFETRLGHAWPGEHALTLEHAWGRDQEHGIIFPAAAQTLEQQRHVQHHEFDPAPGTGIQKLAPGAKYLRMQDHLRSEERRVGRECRP